MNQMNMYSSNHYTIKSFGSTYSSHADADDQISHRQCNFEPFPLQDLDLLQVTSNYQYHVQYNNIYFSIDHPNFHCNNKVDCENDFEEEEGNLERDKGIDM